MMQRYFACFLILPALAVYRLTDAAEPRLLLAFFVFVSLATYFLYWFDKRRAGSGGRRTPESTLHLLELLGGWIAAFIAQRQFHHKTAKPAYQRVYWSIVGFHQLLSFEYAFHWPILRALGRLVN